MFSSYDVLVARFARAVESFYVATGTCPSLGATVGHGYSKR